MEPPHTIPRKDTFFTPLWTLLFWPLVGCIVFFGLLLYSLHIPASFETPVKGLSALIASIFALFGLKWDASTRNASAHHLFRLRTIVILGVILAVILLILGVERCVYLKVRALPGTTIYVDGEYRAKIAPVDPDAREPDPDELRERVIAIPLRWGWRTIQLKDTPLSPGNVEEFREYIRFPLLEWDLVCKLWDGKSEIEETPGSIKDHVAKGPSQWDRSVRSRMTIASLVSYEPEPAKGSGVENPAPLANGADISPVGKSPHEEICKVISSRLEDFWKETLTSQQEHGNLKGRLNREQPSLLILRPARDQPQPENEIYIEILARGEQEPVSLASIGFPIRYDDRSSIMAAATGFLDVLPDVLSRRIADEDLALWYTRRFVEKKEELGQAIEKDLSYGAARRNAEAITAKPPGKLAAADVLQALESLQAAPQTPDVKEAVLQLEEIGSAEPSSLSAENAEKLKATLAKVEPVLDSAFRPAAVIHLHLIGEGQRGALQQIEASLKTGDPHRRVLGFENVEGKARIPDTLEVRYFVNDEAVRSRAEEIVKEVEAAMDWSAGEKARALYVVPSEFDRRNTVDLGYQFELWPAKDSFPSPP